MITDRKLEIIQKLNKKKIHKNSPKKAYHKHKVGFK